MVPSLPSPTLMTLRAVQPLRESSTQVNNTAPLPIKRFVKTFTGRLNILGMENLPDSFAPRVVRELEDREYDSDETILLDGEESKSTNGVGPITIEPTTANDETVATRPET